MAARTGVRHTIRAILIGVPLVFVAWGASGVVVTLFQGPGQPVAVIARGGMQSALSTVIAADGYILQIRGDTVIAISDEADFVPRLYREGALVVLAASPNGCIATAPASSIVRRPVIPPRPVAPSI